MRSRLKPLSADSAVVVVERKATGELHLDHGEHGHHHQETAVAAGAGSPGNDPPMPIDFRIAAKSPTGYSQEEIWQSSGECRLRSAVIGPTS